MQDISEMFIEIKIRDSCCNVNLWKWEECTLGWMMIECSPCVILYGRVFQGQNLNVMATNYFPDIFGSFCELCVGMKSKVE